MHLFVLVKFYFHFYLSLINIIAAVSALAKFGAAAEELLPNILVLLQRTTLDQDDEVRDRATFYYQLLKQNDKALNSAYILNCK
jgi:coatomer protein complex subunit gamma